jgi:DNA-binding phage protein
MASFLQGLWDVVEAQGGMTRTAPRAALGQSGIQASTLYHS